MQIIPAREAKKKIFSQVAKEPYVYLYSVSMETFLVRIIDLFAVGESFETQVEATDLDAAIDEAIVRFSGEQFVVVEVAGAVLEPSEPFVALREHVRLMDKSGDEFVWSTWSRNLEETVIKVRRDFPEATPLFVEAGSAFYELNGFPGH